MFGTRFENFRDKFRDSNGIYHAKVDYIVTIFGIDFESTKQVFKAGIYWRYASNSIFTPGNVIESLEAYYDMEQKDIKSRASSGSD